MRTDELLRWIAQAPEICVCGRLIPDTAIYYGFPLSDDADVPMAFVNEWHDHCLGEWGWTRDDSEFGIAHTHHEEVASRTSPWDRVL